MQGWTRGVRGTELFQMLQESFAWLPSTGFPTADPNVTLTFPVVVAGLAASSHTAQARPAPFYCYENIHSRNNALQVQYRAAPECKGIWGMSHPPHLQQP